ncbi:cholesterol acyltransferase/Alpha/beta hydrolase family [Cardinium endosymbiont of Sogatella furcifera]|nr:cholesterol acyltransferase/Alpha/beta hydrolase family [Cardinium endosymbiont of Sogatella furcifera]
MSYIFSIFRLISFCLLFAPGFVQAKSVKNQGELVVLFHGLGNRAACFDTMKQALEQALPTASMVALTSMEGMQSIHLSIKEQAEASFKELASKVESLYDRSILLVGHSMGAQTAYAFFQANKDRLNIKGLVALGTPWEGVPGARVDAAMLAHHLNKPILDDLSTLSLSLGHPKTYLEEQLMANVQANQAVCLCPGGKDLMEDSDWLSEVKTSLRDETLDILAIGGGQSDFRALLNKKGAFRFKDLNNIYTFFVVGTKYPNLTDHHDMQIPLYSQHALNIVPKVNKKFKRVLIKDAFHSTHVLGIPVPRNKAMLSHPHVLYSVIRFAKRVLK